MKTVVLIGSRHREHGRCTSRELYTILEEIRPEVIFEEQPASKFDDYHVFNNSMSLESTAINAYSDKYGVDIVLVDAETEAETIIEKYGKVHKKVEGSLERFGFDYRTNMSAVHSRQSAGGFEFLNSELSQVYYRLIDESIQSALIEFNDEVLKSIHAEWQEVIEFRENTMIENIYKYSEHNDFQTGAFLIGSYHLKSITEKIKVYDGQTPFKIFWKNLSYICS